MKKYSSLLCSLLILLAFSHASFFSHVANANKLKGFTLDVVHRRSKLSPFYNQSAISTFESGQRSYKLGSEATPVGGDYVIKLYVGNPPVEVYSIADTGSDLVWFQSVYTCPECYEQGIHLYEPRESSTFSPVGCDEPECHYLPSNLISCDYENECRYTYVYANQDNTGGVVSRETISFRQGSYTDSSGEEPVLAHYPNIVVGCALQIQSEMFQNYHIGIFGLNKGPLSLISQLGMKKFSYCLPPVDADSPGKIVFGEDVITNGSVKGVVSTPLLPGTSVYDDNFYNVKLEGATVAGSKTMIPNNQGTASNIILDSGTEFQYLEPGFQNSLQEAVKKAIGLTPVQDNPLCYNEVPEIEVVFHFTGADVTLKPLNLFSKQADDVVCFTMMPSQAAGAGNAAVRIWGNKAQMNFQVTYDLENKLVSFAPADCARV